jgi:hypothetical protein
LSKHFKTLGVELLKYEHQNNPAYLLLVDPTMVNNEWISLTLLWQRYLVIKYPNTKLLIAGFDINEHCNYINLLVLPKNIKFLHASKRVAAILAIKRLTLYK